MFPSQRGHFFKGQGSIGSNNGGRRSSRSLASFRSRSKSPPLGASAQTTPPIASKNQTPMSSVGSAQDDKSTVDIPTVLPTFHDTLSKITLRSRSRPSRRPSHTSKHLLSSSITSPSSNRKSEYNPFLSQFNSTINTPQIRLSRIPSSWSNQQWSVSDPFYNYKIPERFFKVGSVSSNSKAICSQSKDGQCNTKLPVKTQQERLLVKKLCDEALKNRRHAFAFYSDLYDEEKSQAQGRLSEFDPKSHKGLLCEFMLKLVLERQELLDDRRHSFVLPRKNVLIGPEADNPRYTPIYCVGGKTIVGKSYESVNFPNSFAPLTDLHDPKDDPSGFRRFCTLVNMKGFGDNEIFLRINGSRLTVDGVHLNKEENNKYASGARVVSIYVDLPKGVYPDHLTIGRSSEGILVIQEPWKF